MKKFLSPSLRLCLVVLSLAAVSGCLKKINEVNADPGRYAQKEVSVGGVVKESFSIAGRGVYQIDDGTGQLWVYSTHGVPRKDSKVAVTGRVKDGFDLGSLTGVLIPQAVRDRMGSGLVMTESSHKAKD
jgi:hypothetical protein